MNTSLQNALIRLGVEETLLNLLKESPENELLLKEVSYSLPYGKFITFDNKFKIENYDNGLFVSAVYPREVIISFSY